MKTEILSGLAAAMLLASAGVGADEGQTVAPSVAQSGWQVEIGFADGGDKLGTVFLVSDKGKQSSNDITAGGGVTFSGGYRWALSDNWGLAAGLGYKSDDVVAKNGSSYFRRLTADALVFAELERWRFAFGPTLETNTEFKLYNTHTPDIDDAQGVVVQVDYKFESGLTLGLRATQIDYDFSDNVVTWCGNRSCLRQISGTIDGDNYALRMGYSF